MGDVVVLRALYAGKEYAEAIGFYEGFVASCDAEWHLLGSLAYMRSGRWWEASRAIYRATDLPTDDATACKVHFQHGYVARYIGDTYTALRRFDSCLAGLELVPELKPLLKGWTLFHKGVALGFSGNKHHEAITAYEQAKVEFEAEGAKDSLCHCLHNLAWVHLDLGEVEPATGYMDEAYPLCNDDHSRWRQRLLQQHLASVQLNVVEANRLVEWVEREAPIDIRCLSLAVHANLCFDMNLIDEGAALTRAADDLAQKHEVDHRCYRVLLRAVNRMTFAMLNKSGA